MSPTAEITGGLHAPRASARGGVLRCLIIPLIILLSGSLAFCDRVQLQGGKLLEGKILSDGDPLVILLDSGGRVEIPRAQVLRIDRMATPREELARREGELSRGDAAGLYSLARWSAGRGLAEEARRLLWRVLEVDPDHSGARERLGFRKLGAVWLTEEDYQRAHGKVRHGDRWVTEKEWEELERRARSADALERAEGLFRQASGRGGDEERTEALEHLQGMSPGLQRWAVLRGMRPSRPTRERQFAVRLAEELPGRRPGRRLAHLAVTDPRRSVRDEALRVLKGWNHPDTAVAFMPYLVSDDDRQRVNAARALNVFPDRRAVGPLVRSLKMIWAGFGRAHVVQVVQRAYVQDYELVSGGTGLIVQEVADPVVDTFQAGVVLDVDVRRAEAIARISALQKITGQSHGMNFDRWASWWAQETGMALRTPQGSP
ncbi:MAG: HEAT repeat domain-containing protein [Planctomycetota bacterium]